MRRCIKWFTNWFVQWVGEMYWEERIGFSFGAVTGLIIGIMVFGVWDTVPATAMDYKSLEEQMAIVQQNPQLLFQIKCDIAIKDEVIKVSFRNDKCWVTAEYDKDFEILSFSRGNASATWPVATGCAIIIGFFVYIISAFIYTAAIFIVKIIWKWISSKFCKAQK